MDDMSSEALTALMAEATALHELYLTFHAAGFSEDQAFELVRTVLLQAMGRVT